MSKYSYIRQLKVDDVTNNYVEWLNSRKINRYLESRYQTHTLESVTQFVHDTIEEPNTYLFGIFCKFNDKHIGNIKLGPVCTRYQRAEIGLLVGDSDYWGKGIATEAIFAISDFAEKELGLHKLEAGCYEHNIGSFKAFKKVGFEVEGRLKEHFIEEGRRVDCFRLGKIINSSKDKI